MIFGEQKLDIKQLKKTKFIFDIKQLKKMNKFIKSICQLIISATNAALEVPSLGPWMCASLLNLCFYFIIIFLFS